MVGAYGVGGTEAETLKGGLQHTRESTRNLNKTTESPLGTGGSRID